MEKQTFVVEHECEACGGPRGEGMYEVRVTREGDKFGSRQLCDHEIPTHLQARAALAHPKDAIVVYGRCESCRYDY